MYVKLSDLQIYHLNSTKTFFSEMIYKIWFCLTLISLVKWNYHKKYIFDSMLSPKIIFTLFLFLACSGSVLETLTDVAHEYFQDFCSRLRNAADNKLLHGYSGFPVSTCTYHLPGTLMNMTVMKLRHIHKLHW